MPLHGNKKERKVGTGEEKNGRRTEEAVKALEHGWDPTLYGQMDRSSILEVSEAPIPGMRFYTRSNPPLPPSTSTGGVAGLGFRADRTVRTYWNQQSSFLEAGSGGGSIFISMDSGRRVL